MNNTVSYTETELVSLLQLKDERCFNYIYDNYSQSLYTVIISIVKTGDIATEVLQDSFVKIWSRSDSYQPGKGRLYTWMINIARNTAIDAVRKKSYSDAGKTQTINEVLHDHSIASLNIDYIGIGNFVEKLKYKYRRVINMAFLQGFTHEEISRELNIPLGSVKTYSRAGLIQLRGLLTAVTA